MKKLFNGKTEEFIEIEGSFFLQSGNSLSCIPKELLEDPPQNPGIGNDIASPKTKKG